MYIDGEGIMWGGRRGRTQRVRRYEVVLGMRECCAGN